METFHPPIHIDFIAMRVFEQIAHLKKRRPL